VTVRASQTPEHWGSAFRFTDDDREFLLNLFIEDEMPRDIDALALALMQYRTQREEATLRKMQQAQGTLYQPKRAFQVGEQIIFPMLDFAAGRITAIRAGDNPELGGFKVIQVDMNGQGQREFAAELNTDHRLNADDSILSPLENLLTPDELYARYGNSLKDNLEKTLATGPDFVRLSGLWFPRAIIVEVNEGHLNLAEAILDMNGGGPLPTDTLLRDVGLPKEINHSLQTFSLNYTLQQDDRFDEVGPAGEVLWFLHRLEPAQVISLPHRLAYAAQPFDRARIPADLLKIEQFIDDELSDTTAPADLTDEVAFTLTFPHRSSGTLPLTPRIAKLFPSGRTHRIRFMFEDAHTGTRWPGWVVREHRYAYGLETWYSANDVPAGAYITLRRGSEPGLVIVELQGQRQRREWVRVAAIKDNRLTFEMLRRPIPSNYDDQMIIVVEDIAGADKLFNQIQEHATPTVDLIEQLLPDLAKLSPQGNVHAKILYAAINVIQRIPPGPLFAALIHQTAFRSVGDGYWIAR
jgi:hypothetical protein